MSVGPVVPTKASVEWGRTANGGVTALAQVQDEAARDARQILDAVWVERLAGRSIPIDPVKIARRLGIDVVEAQLRPRVSGAIVKDLGHDPTIVLNAMDSDNRKRFTCAHEIGHFVRRTTNLDNYEFIDFRDDVASTGHDPEEIYANTFAASLLMPEEHIRRFRRKGRGEIEMAIRFGVSREAMRFRLANLGMAAA